jgi:hypothetical protein
MCPNLTSLKMIGRLINQKKEHLYIPSKSTHQRA